MRSLNAIGAVAGLLLLAGCSVPTTDSTPAPGSSVEATPTPDPAEGVVINGCAKADYGQVKSNVTITNSTDKVRTFSVTISVNGPDGNRVAEANAFANALAPGQSTTVDATGIAAEAPDALTCVIANVNSF